MAEHGSLPPESDEIDQQINTGVPLSNWVTVPVLSRVDAFSQISLQESIAELRNKSHRHFVLDFRTSRFISVQSIRYCVEIARTLHAEGGRLVLLGCSERIKKHFEVYGSLVHIQVVRNEAELKKRVSLAVLDHEASA
jgi:anti-anti-sigma factor